ncbi:hypothetical protein OQA88_5364 [Cercophora sp. LCS_1]
MGGLGGRRLREFLGSDGGLQFKEDFYDEHVTHLVLGELKGRVRGDEKREVDLRMWLKQAAAISVCEATWGPECPLLLSTIHETLRLGTLGATIRSIMQDHDVTLKHGGTKYFLKKDRLVWASGFAVHASRSAYKDPERFVPEGFLGSRFPETQTPSSFRRFGGGGNICLGRDVMRGTTAAMVASLLMAFDFLPLEKGETLRFLIFSRLLPIPLEIR